MKLKIRLNDDMNLRDLNNIKKTLNSLNLSSVVDLYNKSIIIDGIMGSTDISFNKLSSIFKKFNFDFDNDVFFMKKHNYDEEEGNLR